MKLSDYVNCYKREDIERYSFLMKSPTIVFPRHFYGATKDMAEAPRESRGFMVADTQTVDTLKFYSVLFIKTIGYGNPLYVFPDKDKFAAAEKLLQANVGKKAIDFHVHTRSTGSHFFDKFSSGDYDAFERMLDKNPNYTHVLFTPTHILTFGLDKPGFILPRLEQGTLESQLEWDKKFTDILQKVKS